MRTMLLAFLLVLFSAAPALAGGHLFVLNKSDATVSIVNPQSGEEETVIEVGEGPHEAATSPDGRTVVVCNYGQQTPGHTLSVIDVEQRRVARTIDLKKYHRPHGILFLDDDRVVVTTEQEQKTCIVNVRTGEVEAAIDTDQRVSHMVALSPDKRTAYVANIGSGSVSVLDLETRELKKIVPTAPGAEGVFTHPETGEVWVTNRSANTVSIIDPETLEVTEELDCGLFPIRIAITPDGEHALVSCARSGDVTVFDCESREELRRIAMNEQAADDTDSRLFGDRFGESPVPIGILIEPDGSRAYVANTNADIVTVIDLDTWEIVDRLRAGKQPDGLAWTTELD